MCLSIQKTFLRFEWKGKVYEFNAFPNGLAMAPRKFTKLLKPVFSFLRSKGHISTSFLDDSLLIGNTERECVENIRDTLVIFDTLGFVVHPEKYVLTPKKQVQYLGVIIDSEQMKVYLTSERVKTLKECCKSFLKKKSDSHQRVSTGHWSYCGKFLCREIRGPTLSLS